MPHPKPEEFKDALRAFLACSCVHHEKILKRDIKTNVPTQVEVKLAYENDPVINRLTDTAVAGVFELMNRFKEE